MSHVTFGTDDFTWFCGLLKSTTALFDFAVNVWLITGWAERMIRLRITR
jgi:hypothetical protein